MTWIKVHCILESPPPLWQRRLFSSQELINVVPVSQVRDKYEDELRLHTNTCLEMDSDTMLQIRFLFNDSTPHLRQSVIELAKKKLDHKYFSTWNYMNAPESYSVNHSSSRSHHENIFLFISEFIVVPSSVRWSNLIDNIEVPPSSLISVWPLRGVG